MAEKNYPSEGTASIGELIVRDNRVLVYPKLPPNSTDSFHVVLERTDNFKHFDALFSALLTCAFNGTGFLWRYDDEAGSTPFPLLGINISFK